MHPPNQVTEALSAALECLEANNDDELFIPTIIQGYIALAHASGTIPQAISASRNAPLPSIAQLGDEEIMSEWEWASNAAKELQTEGITQAVLNVFDISKAEFEEDGYAIEIESDPGTVACSYAVSEILKDTAERIAKIIKLCLSYHGIKILEAHKEEEESKLEAIC